MSMYKTSIRNIFIPAFLVSIAVLVGVANMARAQSNPSWGPQWTAAGELVLPRDYHEWIFLGSPLTPHALNDGKAPFPEYHNRLRSAQGLQDLSGYGHVAGGHRSAQRTPTDSAGNECGRLIR